MYICHRQAIAVPPPPSFDSQLGQFQSARNRDDDMMMAYNGKGSYDQMMIIREYFRLQDHFKHSMITNLLG